MTDDQRARADAAVISALEAARRPLSFTELTGPVREALNVWPSVGLMMGLLARLVAHRRIVRRPLADEEGHGPAGMDVQLCDFHLAGRDPWPDGVGGVRC